MDFALQRLLILAGALICDLLFGDPQGFPHFVIAFGKIISSCEKFLRSLFPKTPKGELVAGFLLVLILCSSSFLIMYFILLLAAKLNIYLALVIELYFAWQCLALRSLQKESTVIVKHLQAADLVKARLALAQIVGRDTESLDEAGISRATVETIAENSADGVVAPLFFLAIGGAPLAVLYKAINTMDSMIAYKNPRYMYFGRIAAKLDDLANFIPARLTALAMLSVTPFVKLDIKNAWRIFKRDRFNHASPNSAQTEAVAAGALKIRLGGSAFYFGKLVEKPSIGDDERQIEVRDIIRMQDLLFATAWLCFAICILIWGLILWL